MNKNIIPLNKLHTVPEYQDLFTTLYRTYYLRRIGVVKPFRYTPKGRLYVRIDVIEKLLNRGAL